MAHQTSGGFGLATPTQYSPSPDIKDPPQKDTTPSEMQPPGVDEEAPQSLEEALMG